MPKFDLLGKAENDAKVTLGKVYKLNLLIHNNITGRIARHHAEDAPF